MTTSTRHADRKPSLSGRNPPGASRKTSHPRRKARETTIVPVDNYDDVLPGSLFLEDGGPSGAEGVEGPVDDWPAVESADENVIAEPAEHRRD